MPKEIWYHHCYQSSGRHSVYCDAVHDIPGRAVSGYPNRNTWRGQFLRRWQ